MWCSRYVVFPGSSPDVPPASLSGPSPDNKAQDSDGSATCLGCDKCQALAGRMSERQKVPGVLNCVLLWSCLSFSYLPPLQFM